MSLPFRHKVVRSNKAKMRGRIFFAFLASVLSPSVAAALAPELVIFPNDGAPLEVEHPQRQTVAVRSPSLSIRYGYHSSWTPLQVGVAHWDANLRYLSSVLMESAAWRSR